MKPVRKKQTLEMTVEEYTQEKVLGEVRESLFFRRLLRFALRPLDKISTKGKTVQLYFFFSGYQPLEVV